MKALTLHQPWATCIAQHGKRVENRTWAETEARARLEALR